MWTCKEICRKIASDEYAEARVWERFLIRFHLWRCKHCHCYETQLRTIGASVHKRFHENPPGGGSLNQLERRVLGSAAGEGETPVDSCPSDKRA